MSSIRVAPGWRGVVYRDDDFHGQSLQFTADVPNLALEGHLAAETGVRGAIDFTHAPGAEGRHDSIRAELSADGDSHRDC